MNPKSENYFLKLWYGDCLEKMKKIPEKNT